MPFLKLIRLQNLLIIGITQCLMYWFVVVPFASENQVPLLLGANDVMLLVLSTILIAAAGYIINDYFDVGIDRINKPFRVIVDNFVARRVAISFHVLFTFFALLIGGYVSYRTGKLWLCGIHFTCAAALWFYSIRFKYMLLAGNLVVAALTALVPALVLLYSFTFDPADGFDLKKPAIIIGAFSVFAFLTTIAREITKDMEDYEGDKTYGCNTLPVKYGILKSKNLVFLVIAFLLLLLLACQFILYREGRIIPAGYLFLFVQIPYFFLIYRIHKAGAPADFHFCNNLNKVIMLMGVLLAVVIL